MNKQRLDWIRARAEATTPPPWYSMEDEETWQLFAEREGGEAHPYQLAKCPKTGTQYAEYWPKPEDSVFITHARDDIPALLAYVEELEEVERIYKRSGDNYDKRIAEFLRQVEKLEKQISDLKTALNLLWTTWTMHPIWKSR